MECLEKLTRIEEALLPRFDDGLKSINGGIARHLLVLHRHIVAQALKELWQELQPEGEVMIFLSPSQARMQTEHHPLLLDRLVEQGKRRKKVRLGQLASWKPLDAPPYAHGIAATGETDILLKHDMLRRAEPGDRGTLPGIPYQWVSYTFSNGWTGLSVYFYDTDSNESLALAAIPQGRQDEWLAFLKLLDEAHD